MVYKIQPTCTTEGIFRLLSPLSCSTFIWFLTEYGKKNQQEDYISGEYAGKSIAFNCTELCLG